MNRPAATLAAITLGVMSALLSLPSSSIMRAAASADRVSTSARSVALPSAAPASVPERVLTASEELKLLPRLVVSTLSPGPSFRVRVTPKRIEPAYLVWAGSSAVQALIGCESTHMAGAVNGIYEGYFQMGPDFWSTYGGLRFASSALYASYDQQAQVAFAGYQARGFSPWSCRYVTGE